jgi:DNA-binding response OmpR family regulator
VRGTSSDAPLLSFRSTPADFAAHPIRECEDSSGRGSRSDAEHVGIASVALRPYDHDRAICGDAVAFLGGTRIHALLCDLGLPDGDGLDVVVIAKQLNPDIKAIALTARDSDDDYKVAFDAGFDHYLTKPFDFGELRRLLS